jgi:hypothetical protein
MNDDPNAYSPDQPFRPGPSLEHPPPYTEPLKASPGLQRLLKTIPPKVEDIAVADDHQTTHDEIATAAAQAAIKNSEARRDAVLAVALAIKRRGGNPMTDWTTQDVDTAYAIADQLIALALS